MLEPVVLCLYLVVAIMHSSGSGDIYSFLIKPFSCKFIILQSGFGGKNLELNYKFTKAEVNSYISEFTNKISLHKECHINI